MRPVVVTATATLASAPADVWPLVTDTDRTNRLLLGEPAVYRPVEAGTKSSARFVAETRIAGFALAYDEAPFEWTENKSFSVYRRMRSGPLRGYTFGVALSPTTDGGTRVDVRLEMEPRHWVFRPVAAVQGKRIVAGTTALAAEIDAHLRDRAPNPFRKPTSPANEERLAYAERELAKRGLDAEAIAALVALVRSGPDADLVRIRPFELAAARGVSPREMLRVLLHAVTVGVVELRWALVCPSCRTANDSVSSLSEIAGESHCHLCDISYGIELDRAVEATFRPHPSVREVTDRMFCIGGPWRTPHVVVQANVDEGASRELEAPAAPGRYRLFARGGELVALDIREGGPDVAHVELGPAGFGVAELAVAPGGRVIVRNARGESLHVKIERLGYASLAATAHLVTTMGEFRRLFSKELLKASTPLRVASCSILFSDLTGSTALYTHAGDAAAFRLVDDHFDVLRKVIADNQGTVVKTMGDAVMAAFLDPETCARAAVECLVAFDAFRRTHVNGEHTGLKVGFFSGPCYVVTANDAIDYFGQTVNCASRVQHLAESGELVLEQEIFERLPDAVRARLEVVQRLEARVKGVDAPLHLVRAKVAAASSSIVAA